MNVVLDSNCILEEVLAYLILKSMKVVIISNGEAHMQANRNSYVFSKTWLLARMQMYQGED